MSMSLYHIAEQYRGALLELSDMDIPQEAIDDTLEALSGEVVEKGRAVAAFVLNLSAEIDGIKAVEKRIAEKRKALEAKEARLREYLKQNMEKCGITEIKALDGSFTAKIGKGRPSVIIDDESLIADDSEFVRWSRTVNKTAIADAIKAGIEVPGAHLETRPALRLT